jgi:ATP-dependent helicase HepA
LTAEPLVSARVTWLAATLRQLRPEKLIVICAQAATAIALRRALLEREGLHAALFHEEMEIVERDRAAAFFADAEEGAQALICSEIGGEGRNFQFAHHLVLFDLPLNPDLLEQRIGRLDRIGQTQTIRIHIPYRMGGPEEILYRWYQEGLDAFAAICPAAGAVYERLGERLRALLAMPQADPAQVDALIADARRERERIGAELAAGRDRLLELHSHHPEISATLVDAITAQDADPALRDYLTRVWDSFGIDIEPGAGATLVLRPGVHRLQEHFPELPEEGLTVTFDRALALAREDREFLTWEHPMTRGAMAMILDSDLGTCALTILRDPDLPTGGLLLEMIHVAQCPAPPELEIGRFLPPTALRLLLDAEGRDRSADFPHQQLRGQCLTRNRRLAHAIIQAKTATLETMMAEGEHRAAQAAAGLEVAARARMTGELDAEIGRLRALARVNPNIRAEEITALEERRDRLSRYLTRVRLHLDALRLVVAA